MTTHAGSCHCGKIAFEVEADFETAMQCNCSLCRRRSYLLAFVPREQLTLKTPVENVSTYHFNKGAIDHNFCATCGCSPFGEGAGPDGTKMAAINLRCVEGVDLSALTIQQVDGASL